MQIAGEQLTKANKELVQRINELDTINEISKAITSILDMDELLNRFLKCFGNRIKVSLITIDLPPLLVPPLKLEFRIIQTVSTTLQLSVPLQLSLEQVNPVLTDYYYNPSQMNICDGHPFLPVRILYAASTLLTNIFPSQILLVFALSYYFL